MKKIILISIALVVSAFAFTACGGKSAADAAVAEPSRLIAEGRLLPVKALDMSFTVAGQVASVFVKEGDAVKKDQKIGRAHV